MVLAILHTSKAELDPEQNSAGVVVLYTDSREGV
jgi:hypothetical protein